MARRPKLAIRMADQLELANVRGLKQIAVHVTHNPDLSAVEIAEECRQHPRLELRIGTERQVDLVPADRFAGGGRPALCPVGPAATGATARLAAAGPQPASVAASRQASIESGTAVDFTTSFYPPNVRGVN